MGKKNISIVINMLLIIFGMLIASVAFYVYSYSYDSGNVFYNSVGTNLTSNTVQGALNELDNRTSGISSGMLLPITYFYGSNFTSDYTSLDKSVFLVRINMGSLALSSLSPVGVCLVKNTKHGCFVPTAYSSENKVLAEIGKFLGVTCSNNTCQDAATGIKCESRSSAVIACSNVNTGESCNVALVVTNAITTDPDRRFQLTYIYECN